MQQFEQRCITDNWMSRHWENIRYSKYIFYLQSSKSFRKAFNYPSNV